jgi:DNA-binding NtrC family response regulator
LLHAIEHREVWPVGADRPVRVDVRLVAATNIPLERLVADGAFLEDLAARLLAFSVRLPALRERRSDIPALVHQFIAIRAASCGHAVGPPAVDESLMEALVSADWPYNLRQLDGAVQRLLMEA